MNKTPPEQTPPTLKAIAAGLEITPRRVSQLKSAGMDCSSIEAAKSWRKAQSSTGEISADQLRAERHRLLRAQAVKVEIENAKVRSELIPASDAYCGGMALGHATKTAFLALLNHLPPRLTGLDEIGIFKILKEEFYRIMDDMHGGRFFDSPELAALIEDFHTARPEPWAAPNKTTNKAKR